MPSSLPSNPVYPPPPPPPAPTGASYVPSYLLTDIFIYLDIFELHCCRAVCREWNEIIANRNVLKPKLFLQPPSPQDDLACPVMIHPILRRLQSDWSSKCDPISVGRSSKRAGGNNSKNNNTNNTNNTSKAIRQFLHQLPVKDSFATSPALKKFVIMVPYHTQIIERDEGVTVWGVAYGLKSLCVISYHDRLLKVKLNCPRMRAFAKADGRQHPGW